MAGSSQNTDGTDSKHYDTLDDNSIVISGISGAFPNSESVSEFMDNLYNKVDMVSLEPRWDEKDLDLPNHLGQVKHMNRFDAQFFKVTYHLARVMEPMSRKLLEHTYGAIFDSGTSLASLHGKRVGVLIGASNTDFSLLSMFDIKRKVNLVINGGSKSMLANRISYWLDVKGPSLCFDNSCASATTCMEKAYGLIKAGDCEAALVGACNSCVNSTLSLNTRRAGLLCMDGKTKCFDRKGDGYVRADAFGMIFLQKAKDAKRIYAEVCHVKGVYKKRPDATFLPIHQSKDIENFLKDFYSEAKINPEYVEYVEAHGSGIVEADKNEMKAISNFFADNKPVKIGSVKSNMGHSESASGICSLTKMCLAYHKGTLPANLHYSEPIDELSGILQDKLQVVTEETQFQRGFVAINNFSNTGANYHVLLKGHYKEKNLKDYESDLPRLVLASGRHEESVAKIFKLLTNQPVDHEQLALLQNVFEHDIPGHTGRGYTILDTNEHSGTVCLNKSIDNYKGEKRPVWFVFSGVGSQWPGMGIDLIKIPTFAKAIDRCDNVLKPKGIDIKAILTEKDSKLFDNIMNVCLAIGAVQIGLIDILKELGIVPDFFIGHSLGEMACAYQDEAFTAEELILATIYRSNACLDKSVVKGAMAAVGLNYKDVINQCPPEIDVACHNSSESSTISGRAEDIKGFVSVLKERGVFAKEVQSSGVPYHSRYISVVGDKLLKELRELIKNPKPRSSKWISTSVPQDKWNEERAKYSSAEYHANNMLSPVLFEEACAFIPDNAIVIEIAPHGLLQAILKRSRKNCIHIPLTKRGTPDGIIFLLDAIGKMYQAGLNPKIDNLYPKVAFPVSTETPLLSHFVGWEHSEDWNHFADIDSRDQRTAITRDCIVSMYDDEYIYLQGYIRDGKNVLAEAAILVLVWQTVAMYSEVDYRSMSVVFEDIHFCSEVNITDEVPLKLSIMINKGNNKFEVTYENTEIANGLINTHISMKHTNKTYKVEEFDDEIRLTSNDIYEVFEKRGVIYKGEFKSVQSSNLACSNAKVLWTHNWVTFLDSLIQLSDLSKAHNGISVPKCIEKLEINVTNQHPSKLEDIGGVICLNALVDDLYGITSCAGVEIKNIRFHNKPIYEIEPDVLATKHFFPYYTMNKVDLATAFYIALQTVSNNASTDNIKLTHLLISSVSKIQEVIQEVIENTHIEIDLETVKMANFEIVELITKLQESDKTNIVVVHNLLTDETILDHIQKVILSDTFILAIETNVPHGNINKNKYFNIITSMSDGKQILVLLKKKNKKQDANTYIKVDYDNNFTWVPQVYAELQKTKHIVLVSEKQPYCGLRGFVKKIRKSTKANISAVIIEDLNAPKFNPECDVYSEQLQERLVVNIFKKGQWGDYYDIRSPKTVNSKNVTLINAMPGSLEKLVWAEAPPIKANSLLVQVCYAGLTMRDVELAVRGICDDLLSFGMDFSGIDKSGDRVMGVVSGGALSSSVVADPELLWPVPDHWSLEDAATVPMPYLLAFYCVTMKTNVRKGQTVFVTDGVRGFSQAVINLCLFVGCNVYTSVNNIEEKNFIMSLFPGLNKSNIDYSGLGDFYYSVMVHTEGKGCNVVINSYTGSHRVAAMKCVGIAGIFIDNSRHDTNMNKSFGMSFLSEEKNYLTIDISNLKLDSRDLKKELCLIISDGISRGIVRPLSRVMYSLVSIKKAVRLISTEKYRGHVVIRMRDPVITNQGLNVIPRMTYSSQGVYIVACDGTGSSIDLADKLIRKGARKLMINLPGSSISGYMQTKFAKWNKLNVTIKLSLDKLYTDKGSASMYREATKMGEISGIFILLKRSGKKTDESQSEFVKTVDKTVSGVFNLDSLSRKLSVGLSHFVVVSLLSNCDSDEYTISLIEDICEQRNSIGLPALILRYDSLNEEGICTKESGKKIIPLTQSTLFEAMERSMKLKYKNVFAYNLNSDKQLHFITTISSIFGVKSMSELIEDIVIKNLNLSEVSLEEIKTAIKYFYQIDHSIEKIKNCSIKSLLELYKKRESRRMEVDVLGLKRFYKFIYKEEDHLTMSNNVIPMPTLVNKCDEDLDPEDNYLIVISGFDGDLQIFTSITEGLKIKAVAIHLGPDMSNESIPKLAADVRRLIKTKLKMKSKFYLMSYCFGVNVALELAAILEKEGHVGVIYCLNSSPDALKVELDTYLNISSINELENDVVEHICRLISNSRSDQMNKDLINIETWQEKKQYCVKLLRSTVNYSNQYKELLLQSAYRRLLLARDYEPNMKLESEVILIRNTSTSKGSKLNSDYNLSNYTKNQVKVIDLESNYKSILNDYKIAIIINKLLDPAIHDELKNKNFCDTYLVQ